VPDPNRYHLTRITAGRTVQHGWWGSEVTARRKFSAWVGSYGTIPDTRITLADDETGETLTTWPDET
jgi:hypothetical protein